MHELHFKNETIYLVFIFVKKQKENFSSCTYKDGEPELVILLYASKK